MDGLKLIEYCRDRVLSGKDLKEAEGLELMLLPASYLPDLLAAAFHIREAYKGKEVKLCAIVNAKSGRCGENCAFCAQSVHYPTQIQSYDLLPAEELAARADIAADKGARMFGIVTSGTNIESQQEWDEIIRAVKMIAAQGRIKPCASLGLLSLPQAVGLKEAGLYRYHHNLETATSFFPQICTTHDYAEDIATVKNAKKAGLAVCCGGIFGLGETSGQRVELAFTLRELEVDSVPLNFLNPIPGTPLGNRPIISPMEALKVAAVYRFLLPRQDLKLCGGKEPAFRQLLPLAMWAANSLMIGNYLTTVGREPHLDIEMIHDLGFEPC